MPPKKYVNVPPCISCNAFIELGSHEHTYYWVSKTADMWAAGGTWCWTQRWRESSRSEVETTIHLRRGKRNCEIQMKQRKTFKWRRRGRATWRRGPPPCWWRAECETGPGLSSAAGPRQRFESAVWECFRPTSSPAPGGTRQEHVRTFTFLEKLNDVLEKLYTKGEYSDPFKMQPFAKIRKVHCISH